MLRLRLCVLLLPALVSACGHEAAARAEEARAQAEQARALAEETAAALEAAAAESGVLLDLSTKVIAELSAMVGREVPPAELRRRSDRMLADLAASEGVLQRSDAGRRLLVETRLRAAALLSHPELDAGETVGSLRTEAMVLAEAALAAESSRERQSLVGDVHAGYARIALARGDHDTAVAEFEKALELLEAADKGRGSGTGTGEFRGEGSGGGKGRGQGKGRNKVKSVAAKHHIAAVMQELAEAYRAKGDYENECGTIQRERHVVGKLCMIAYGSPGHGYQSARMGMSELIDRLGDAAVRFGEPGLALMNEELALNILREIAGEAPEEPSFLLAIPDQALEVLAAQADQVELERLRSTVSRTLDEDLPRIAKIGMEPDERAAFEARVSYEMARGLAAAAAQGDGGAALWKEAVSWFGRVLEQLDGLAELPDDLAALKAAASEGLRTAEAGAAG